MKVDMSPEAITKRLKIVNELRRTCLSLANSSAGKSTQKNFQPTSRCSGPRVRSAADIRRWPMRENDKNT